MIEEIDRFKNDSRIIFFGKSLRELRKILPTEVGFNQKFIVLPEPNYSHMPKFKDPSAIISPCIRDVYSAINKNLNPDGRELEIQQLRYDERFRILGIENLPIYLIGRLPIRKSREEGKIFALTNNNQLCGFLTPAGIGFEAIGGVFGYSERNAVSGN